MANTKVKQQGVLVPIPAGIGRRFLRAQKIRVRSGRNNSFAKLYRFLPSEFFSLMSKLRASK